MVNNRQTVWRKQELYPYRNMFRIKITQLVAIRNSFYVHVRLKLRTIISSCICLCEGLKHSRSYCCLWCHLTMLQQFCGGEGTLVAIEKVVLGVAGRRRPRPFSVVSAFASKTREHKDNL
jgi:hypothetical protein